MFRFVLTFACLCVAGGLAQPSAVAAAISFVQVNAATPQTSLTTVAVTYPAAQSAGHLNVVVVGWNDTTHSVVSVTDSAHNIYSLAVGPTVNAAGSLSQSIYYAQNITAAPAGGNTVTVTFNGPTAFPDIRILEYGGADLTAPVDVTSTGTGSNASSSAAAVTTTHADDLLLAANTIATLTTAPGAGFTNRIITTPNGQIVEDRLVAATGSYGATAALNVAGPWVMQMVAFRAADGPPTEPDPTPPTAPSNLTATAASSTLINLAWTAATDTVGVTSYRVERCQGAGCSTFGQVATPTTTTFSDAGRTASTSYSYRVRATDAAGNLGPYSPIASATTLAAPPPAGTISFVQVNAATPQPPQTSVALPYQAAQAAGNLNVVVVGVNDAVRSVASVTDTAGNVYALGVGRTVNTAGGLSQAIYYASNIAAAPAGANVVTVTFDGAAASPDIRILEYSGADVAAPVDVTAAATGNSATSSTAAVTTTQANTLLFAANTVATLTAAPGASFTSRIITTPNGQIAEDRLVATAGSYTATAALSVAGPWVMQMVAFRVAGAAPPVPDTTPPTAPSNLTATAPSATQINLAWTAATDTVGVTGYRVERCQGAGCSTFAQIATPTTTTFNDTGLTASTSYSYRVRATDAAGNLGPYSGAATATTPALPDTTPPTAPSNLTATAPSATQINLAWTAATDTVGVTGYRVERCQGAGCSTFAQIATPATTTFNDTGLTASTSYSYRVRATDAAGNLGPYSGAATATTPALPDTTPPTAPSNLTATAPSATQINLAWTAATDTVGVTGYRVERCQGAGCSTFAQIATPTTTTFNDTGLTASTSYSYRVRATDAAGNLGPYSGAATATTPALPDTTPPTAPSNLTATAPSATQINLAWTAATDTVGVTGYRVERCQGAGCSTFAQIATPATTTFNDTGLTASTSYSYRVRATDAAGNLGPYSGAATATTPALPDTTPPTAPSNLTATAPSATQINLAWTAATDTVGVTGYRVERCQGAGCSTFAQIATPTTTTFNDTGLTASTSYSYRVRATDAAGNLGPYSGAATATTPALPDTTPPTAPSNLTATAPSATQINLAWTAATDTVGVTGYRVERCQGAGCSTFAQIATPTTTTFNDTGLTASTSYSYRVRATDAAGNLGPYSGAATATTPALPDTTPPTAPSNLTATAPSATQINLAWTAATDTVGVTGYRVERCQGAGCSTFAQIATPTTTTFNDTGLTASTSYSYRVRATDAAGNLGPYSSTTSATTLAAQPPPGTISFIQVNAATPQPPQTSVAVTYQAAQAAGNLNVVVVGVNDAVRSVASVTDTAGNVYALAVGRTVNTAGGLSQAIYYAPNIAAAPAGANVVTVTFDGAAASPDIRILEYSGADVAAPVDVTAAATGNSATSSTAAVTTIHANTLLFAANTIATLTTAPGAGFTNRIITTPNGQIAEDRLVTTAGSYTATAALNVAGPWVMQMVAFRVAGGAPVPDTTPPTAPSNLTATAPSATQINLAWTAATDTVGVTGYRVERCQGAGCSTFAQIATPTTTTFNDTGLTALTSYSYRVRAIDAAGNLGAYSNTASASTPATDVTPPTAPSNLTTTPAGSTQINLAWTAATDTVGVTGYRVERCQGAGCSTFAQIATPTTTTFNDTGLTASTSYSYRVRATDAAGNLGPYSNTASATTEAAGPPTGIISFVQVNAATPQPPQTSVAVPYQGAQSAGNLNVVVVGVNDAVRSVVSVTDTAGNVYSSAVGRTVNTAGLSQAIYYAANIVAAPAGGNTVTVTFDGAAASPDIRILEYSGADATLAVDVTSTGMGSTATSSTAAVTTTNASNLLFAANTIATVTTAPGAGFTSRIITTPNGQIAEDRMVTATGSYTASAALNVAGPWVMQMVAFRAAGSPPPGPDTTPPTAPANLTATPVNATQLNLAWTAATDAVGVTGYRVERCQGAGCSTFAQIATPMATTFNDTGLTALTSYSYRVRATDATGNLGPYSNIATATMPALDTTPPTAPTNLTGTPASASRIDLAWTASTDGVGVTGYRMERCQGAGCSNFAQIATPTATTFGDTGLSASTTYRYRVRATDAAGNLSAYSNTASATTPGAQSNPIVTENLQPGTTDWQLGDRYGRPYASDAVGQIKGYASLVSVNKGGSIAFHVSVNPAQTFTIDVYRIGWYQGLGGRLMQHIGPLNGIRQPTCPTNASTGMIACNWSVAYTLDTQAWWTSGVYVGVLRNAQGFYSYMVFAVRDDSRVGALLYQQPVTTYQAYNNYPDDGQTGKGLYDHNSYGANTLAGSPRAVKVSFDRPYGGGGAGQLFDVSETNFIRFAEKSGYDITYSTDVDTHRDGANLLNHRGFLSLPHDEYWSKQMYDAAIAARDAGVNLAFLGANSVFWQIRFEPSSSGVANRVIVCYKEADDPISDPNLKTVKWRDSPVNRPEQTLVGVQFTDGPNNGTATYVVTNSGNWVYQGTGFSDGDTVPGIVWYEADRLLTQDPGPVAVSGTYTKLSHSPYTDSHNQQDYASASIYQAPSGAWVFATGTMGWGWGLDDFYPEGNVDTVDVRIQRTMTNILDRFIEP